jgi:hypothetical protein
MSLVQETTASFLPRNNKSSYVYITGNDMAPLERYTMHGTSVLRLFWRRRDCFSSTHLTQQLTRLSIYLDYLRVLLTGSNSRTLPPGNTISATSILLLVTETSLCPCLQIRANAGCIQLLVHYSSSIHYQSLSLLPFPTSIHLSPVNDVSPRPSLEPRNRHLHCFLALTSPNGKEHILPLAWEL